MQIAKNASNLENTTKEHNSKIILNHRKQISLSGVEEVFNSNESCIILKISGSKLQLNGSNISISKLDIENKILEATGFFNCIKFYEKQEGLFKKFFK